LIEALTAMMKIAMKKWRMELYLHRLKVRI